MKNKITLLFCLVLNQFFSQVNACFFSQNNYSYNFPGEQTKYSQHGDINNDGKLDIVVALQSQKIVCMLGSGTGTFTPGNSFTIGHVPWYMQLKDINNDGNLDCITLDVNLGNVNVLIGTGTGSFVNTGTINCGWPGGSSVGRGIEVVDVNNDSNKDIVVSFGNMNPNVMTVLTGNGLGAFGAPNTYTTGYSNAIAASDLNNDGFIDIIETGGSFYANVGVNWGNATGTYTLLTTYSTGTLTGTNVHVFDYNNDGSKDLIISHGLLNSAFSIFKGNGTSSFTISTTSNIVDMPFGASSGDYNGDGKIDIALQRDGGISILNGNGLGTFTYHKSYATDVLSPGLPSNIGSVDFNNDGKLDIYTCPVNGVSRLRVLINEGNSFSAMPYIINKKNTAGGLIAYDLNNDGNKDIINGVVEGFEVSFGINNFAFNTPVTYSVFGTSASPLELFLEDVNGDSNRDVVSIVGLENKINVCFGNGTGTFSPAGAYSIGAAPVDAEWGDFNNDGIKDLAILANASVKIFTNTGTGVFNLANTFTTNTDGDYITVADYNNDGNKDIAYARMNSGLMYILDGNGSNSFTQSGIYSTSFSQPTGIESADVNNDSYVDIVVINMQNTNNVNVFLGTPSGSFQPYQTFSTDNWPIDLKIDDLNNDGNKDIVTTSYQNETFSILLGTGTGSFGVLNNYVAGRTFQGMDDAKILINDFDNDGLKDLILKGSQTTNSGVLFALNKNANIISAPNTNTFCAGSSINLIANPANNYSWQPGGQATSSISVNASGNYTVTVTNANGCISSATKSVTAVVCTNIMNNTVSASSFNLFPNPANSYLSINASNYINKVEVINSMGQTVLFNDNVGRDNTTLDLSNLANGVYFVQIKTDDGTETKKIIKN